MRLPNRIVYVPGMISLVTLPLLINNYTWKYVKHYQQHAMEIRAERSICDDSPGPHICAPGTDIVIYGAAIRPYPTMRDVQEIAAPNSSKKNIDIDEFFTLQYARETLAIVGFCFVILAGFGARRMYLQQR